MRVDCGRGRPAVFQTDNAEFDSPYPLQFALVSLVVEVLFCKQGVVVRFHPGAPSLFHSSTAVVQLTVNQLVVGSIPACGAILKENDNETC